MTSRVSSVTDVKFGGSLIGIEQGVPTRGAVLISHGAGGNMRAKLLEQTAERLADLGFLTLRWNFGYTTKNGAPSAGGKRERPEMVAAVEFLSNKAKGKPVILIGKSFGGRVSTYIVEDAPPISGYVFFGLPIQGMSDTSKSRDWSHLAKLKGRALFITGDKDKLCPLEQLEQVQEQLIIPYESIIVPGDHSYKPRGEAVALDACVKWIDTHFE